jgi:hypothetical protein
MKTGKGYIAKITFNKPERECVKEQSAWKEKKE